MLLHVASGKVLAERVTKLRGVKTLNGQSLRIRTTGGTVRVGGAKVTQADVLASNGVIHVIDRVLIPS